MRLAPTPLSPVAVAFYTSGGCWNLALALHDATGLPIELYHLRGQATHAYVVDGDHAIDARGRNPLRLVRRGAERTEQVDLLGLLAALERMPNGPAVRAFVERPDLRDAAALAAAVLLEWSAGRA